jgi:hypothetical protein
MVLSETGSFVLFPHTPKWSRDGGEYTQRYEMKGNLPAPKTGGFCLSFNVNWDYTFSLEIRGAKE